jgi:hypothetical protein
MSERTFLDEVVDQAEQMFRRESFCDLRTALNFATSAAFRHGVRQQAESHARYPVAQPAPADRCKGTTHSCGCPNWPGWKGDVRPAVTSLPTAPAGFWLCGAHTQTGLILNGTRCPDCADAWRRELLAAFEHEFRKDK